VTCVTRGAAPRLDRFDPAQASERERPASLRIASVRWCGIQLSSNGLLLRWLAPLTPWSGAAASCAAAARRTSTFTPVIRTVSKPLCTPSDKNGRCGVSWTRSTVAKIAVPPSCVNKAREVGKQYLSKIGLSPCVEVGHTRTGSGASVGSP